MTYHSQFGQDRAVQELFPPGYKGTYVDVGASDGLFISNTAHLEDSGWRGLCVEADPVEYEALTRNRSCAMVNVACANTTEPMDWQVIPVRGWSGLKELHHELNEADISRLEAAGQVETIKVACRPLQDILEEYGITVIDYLSLDVEGAELSVLESIDWGRTRIKVATVEANRKDQRLVRFLLERQFCLWAILHADEMYVSKAWLKGGRP